MNDENNTDKQDTTASAKKKASGKKKKNDPREEIRQQATSVWKTLLSLATRKYRINFELYGWLIALIGLVILVLIML